MSFRAMAGRLATLRELDRPIVVLAGIAFISAVGVSIMLPLLPLYARQLGASPAQLGLMVSIFAVTQTVGQLGSGAMLGRVSPRRQMPLGQVAYATANFLIATASAAVPLIAFRALAGFGGGLSIIAERLYIARVADRARLAFTNGIVSAAGSSGSVLGPTIGAVLAVQDLRVPFIVVGLTATLAAIGAVAFLPPEPAAAAAVTMPVLPETAEDVPAIQVAAGQAATAESGIAVRAADAVAAEPAAPSRWQRVRPLLVISLWNLCFSAAYGGWITTFAPYSTANLGMHPSQVALIFAFFGLGSIVIGPYLSRVADRNGRRRMVAIGTALVLVNFGALIVGAPLALIYASAVVAGGGLAAAQSAWFALLSVATDGGRRGRSFGFVTALSNLGVIAGATLASQIWERIGLWEGLIAAGSFLVLAAASLVFVPRDRPEAQATG
jgi:MFS family permease